MKIVQYAAIFRKKKMLILQYSDYIGPIYKDKWGLPGGHLEEKDRNPVAALRREISEETRLRIKNVRPIFVNIKKYIDGRKRFIIFYRADSSRGEVKLSNEHTDYEWVDIKAIQNKRFHSGQEREMIMLCLNSVIK